MNLVYNKKVIKAITSINDSFKYFPIMVKWVGFNTATVNVNHSKRYKGKTSYSLKKSIKLAIDVILAFSDKPLKLTIKFGLLISLSAFIFAIFNIIKYFNGQIEILGWASLIISIWLLSGLIIFLIGILGLYIGKIFEKVKNRPIYIIKNKINA